MSRTMERMKTVQNLCSTMIRAGTINHVKLIIPGFVKRLCSSGTKLAWQQLKYWDTNNVAQWHLKLTCSMSIWNWEIWTRSHYVALNNLHNQFSAYFGMSAAKLLCTIRSLTYTFEIVQSFRILQKTMLNCLCEVCMYCFDLVKHTYVCVQLIEKSLWDEKNALYIIVLHLF